MIIIKTITLFTGDHPDHVDQCRSNTSVGTHNDVNMAENSHICPICGESKDPSKARFEHRRIGLDEPPEPVVCKCRDPNSIFASIVAKVNSVTAVTRTVDNMTMESLPHPTPNMVMIEAISPIPVKEVEVRLDAGLAKLMYTKLNSGMFASTSKRTIRETGCTWWTGPLLNANARVRKRSNGEAVVKVSRTKVRIAPGYTLAYSDEYGFDGIIKDATYNIEMTEIRYTITMPDPEIKTDTKINLMARMYTNNTRTSYAAEFEIEGRVTNAMIRRIICMSASMVGHVSTMKRLMDIGFMSDVRSADHVVIDVPNLNGYKGRYMAKADGIKVYVLCYMFGYVITLTDPDLTIISCMTTISNADLPELTDKPDIVVAEMLMDGSLVYIDTLAMGGSRIMPNTIDKTVCPIITEKPSFILRRSWPRMPSKLELSLEPTPNDGVVMVNEFRTMRLKEPTVDLLYTDGKLCASDNGVMVPVADGDANMEVDAVYEMDLVKDKTTSTIMVMRPRQRVAKKVPNSMEVVKRAIASANKDPMVDAAILDLTSMSFAMRERVYTMAQTKASRTRKVIVTFGIGRFQEWRQMMTNGMSYIAIDPDIDITMVTKKMRRVTIMPYDFNTPFNTQVIAISKRGSTILWAKCKSEYFIDRVMPSRTMAMAGIPAVFSFSISYHIGVINRLLSEGVTVFGCGFVHDSMPRGGVGEGRTTMVPRNGRRASGSDIVSTFGKSTYIEPYLSRSSIPGLFLVKDEMPTLWRGVDSNTIEIMERAVIMYAS